MNGSKQSTILCEFVMTSDKAGVSGSFPVTPVEVKVGGATVFIVNVERFEKC